MELDSPRGSKRKANELDDETAGPPRIRVGLARFTAIQPLSPLIDLFS